jgi:radical SAM superfamily enzyme YgiQ (UPF0313 family)
MSELADVRADLRGLIDGYSLDSGVVLIHIPQIPLEQLNKEVADTRGYFAYPPTGLLYLSAFFRSQNIPCEIVDLNFAMLKATQEGEADLEALWKKKIDDAIGRHKKPFVGISFMFEATRAAFEDVCRYVRSTYPDLFVANGGVNATADPEELLRAGFANMVFRNEGEQSLDAFYQFARGESNSIPPNLVFLNKDKELRETTVRSGGPVELDIKREYEEIPTKDYHSVGCLSNFSRINGLDIPFGTVIAKRGCRARCAFCGVRNFNGKGIRLRGVTEVVDEMQHLHDKFGVRHFDWLDDDLMFDRKETLKLLVEIKKRLPNITWAANNGLIPAAVTEDLFEAIAQSGCVGFKVGLETGSPEMLHRVHKPTNIPNFLKFSKRAEKHRDVFVSVNFILGLPEERFGQMLDSMKVAVQSRLHWHNYYIYQHLKNTEFYIAYGGLGDAFKVKEHGKDSQSPTFEAPKDSEGKGEVSFINPVRDGKFESFEDSGDVPTGYGVFDIPLDKVPPRSWVNEIWFSINTVVNFILNPCVSGDSEVMLKQMIKWLEVLSTAYPQDAVMKSLQFYLMDRSGDFSKAEIASVREKALELSKSKYWTHRDKQFGYTAFLDKVQPELPEKLKYLYKEKELLLNGS